MLPLLSVVHGSKRRNLAARKNRESYEYHRTMKLARDNGFLRVLDDGSYDMDNPDPDNLLPNAVGGNK